MTRFGEIDQTTSRIITKAFINYRLRSPITHTKQIEEVINSTIIRDKFKFIVKVFQALRIYVNNELDDVHNLCTKIPSLLSPDGHAMTITFHSLEEETAKRGFLSEVPQKILRNPAGRKRIGC